MKIGGKPSGPPLDLAFSLPIACLANADENITLLQLVLVTGGVETTGICPLSVVNIDVEIEGQQFLYLQFLLCYCP